MGRNHLSPEPDSPVPPEDPDHEVEGNWSQVQTILERSGVELVPAVLDKLGQPPQEDDPSKPI